MCISEPPLWAPALAPGTRLFDGVRRSVDPTKWWCLGLIRLHHCEHPLVAANTMYYGSEYIMPVYMLLTLKKMLEVTML